MTPTDTERHLSDCLAAEAMGGCFWLAMAEIHRRRLAS